MDRWRIINRVVALDMLQYRLTGGRFGSLLLRPRAPALLLDHKGARSGKVRTAPLVYTEDGDDLVIVASKGGHPKHPAWFHNLEANPETTVLVGSEQRAVRARVAADEERDRLWPKVVATYPPYAEYQERAGGRKIPVLVLERVGVN